MTDFAEFIHSFENTDGLMSIEGRIETPAPGEAGLVRLLWEANKTLQKTVCDDLKIIDEDLNFFAKQSLRLLEGSIEGFAGYLDGEPLDAEPLVAAGEELFLYNDAIIFAQLDDVLKDEVSEAVRSLDFEFDSEEAIEAGFAAAGVALVQRLVAAGHFDTAMYTMVKLNGLIMSIHARIDERGVSGRKTVHARLERDPKQEAKSEIKKIWIAQRGEYQRHGGKTDFAKEMVQRFPVLKSVRKITQWITAWESGHMSPSK